MIDTISDTNPEEEQLFSSLRAQSWQEFYGQQQIKQALHIAIAAARERQEALDHTLFFGPPGLGKTTLAQLIAREMDAPIHITAGTALSKVGDLAAILSNLEPFAILFIDEIHRLPKAVEEALYPVMEDFALDIVLGKGPAARTLRIDLPRFTLVGATTRYGLLAGPLRDRFGLVHRLSYYDNAALCEILTRAAKKLKIQLLPAATELLARRARGTPRIGLKLLKRVRDYAQIKKKSSIDQAEVNQALQMISIDSWGLDEHDRQLLESIIKLHRGGPVGLATLAATLNEDTLTIEEVIEPYLIQIGFLHRTPKGRVVTRDGYQHLGLKPPS